MSVIILENLSKTYKGVAAITDVNLVVDEGEIFGFIGPNGAGKSTTIRLMLDFIRPTSGKAILLGMDAQKQSKEIKKAVAYVSSDVRFYNQMTTAELVQYSAQFHKLSLKKADYDYYYELFEIEPHKKMHELSLGNKKKVSLMAGLLTKPKLIILDEPSSGLDPLIAHRLFEELKSQQKNGMGIFLSSHDLHEVEKYCTRAAFIKNGEILQVEDIGANRNRGKMLELWGANIDVSALEQKGAHIIERTAKNVKLTYPGDMQKIMPLLAKLELEDININNQQLEDKFLALYEHSEKKEKKGGYENGVI
ncbi:ABC transporter ATP-binding protein [Erysipelotrichaceae bacterium]|nr:ABC transporter ATP-binding protein [Erysipelotrichaceae bacterium]